MRIFNQDSARILFAQIGQERAGESPGLTHLPLGFRQFFPRGAVQSDRRARLGESDRQHAPDAAARPGDEDGLAFQRE